jgi:caspase-like apoptosis-related cysteine protease
MIKKYSENCDFMTILTMINNTVAYQFESNNKDQIDNHKKKQMPCTTTMLTRLIFFKPKSPLEGLTQ